MTTLELTTGLLISDGTTSLTLAVRRDLDDEARPVVLVVDGLELGLTVDVADKLARAGERIERALFKAKEAPKESSALFAYKFGSGDGTVEPFEIGIIADPLGVSFVWGAKRLALGLGSIADLLFALSQVGRAVDAIRGVSEPGFDEARGAPQRSFRPQPPPGQRWRRATPRCWSDPEIGGPGW